MDFQAIYDEAYKAGCKAGMTCRPTPMMVGQAKALVGAGADEIDYTKQVWLVDDGACGFAWVEFKGNTPWGRWAAKQGDRIRCSKHWKSGYQIWVSEFNQSIERKEAFARAFAQVLKKHGITAYSNSRLD